ncbi:hypothetical protein SADUNF_Sadunf03G0048000 [Salix dunnii]|uniref:Uncharacterized protein n=1 Tax=Salix dunnii TaxID=1413687 RepID=A0A835KD34_9ROSI|nr:hypothetical protein SADUNF_Sadunf03G0048000 [Salix dunnii]
MAEIKFQVYNKRGGAKKAPATRRSKGHGFTTKCAALVKEQRARIYILRRCATMLLCWVMISQPAIAYKLIRVSPGKCNKSLFLTALESNPMLVSGGTDRRRSSAN